MFGLLIAIIYLSFISLGLPDSLLGAAWSVMRADFDVPLSFAGIISMTICAGTILSCLLSDRLTKKLGTCIFTAVSVTLTAVALFCFSVSTSFWMLVVSAVPYGLGAGGVDAALNNYVALHLKSRHMSWLHCMWGVGAAVSPYIMSFALTRGMGWNRGYLIISVIQIILAAAVFASFPLWKKSETKQIQPEERKPLSLKQIFTVKGAVPCFLCFLCYCSLEQTTMLWASTYMVDFNSLSVEEAAMFASLFFIGITAGRGVNGFLTFRFADKTLIRTGQVLLASGVVLICIPSVKALTIMGFIIIGLGCAPVYPSLIHRTPQLFGSDKSQAIIGVQMASAYTGSCFAPPLYGLIANHVSTLLLPAYLAFFLVLMILMHELMNKSAGKAAVQK